MVRGTIICLCHQGIIDPQVIVSELLDHCLSSSSRDNMTVILVLFMVNLMPGGSPAPTIDDILSEAEASLVNDDEYSDDIDLTVQVPARLLLYCRGM